MEQIRLTRFKRVSAIPVMEMTERDRQIIRHVHRHRFLRSWQIIALVGGSRQQVLRRLKLLYHHGYLERPRYQLQYFHQGGSRHIIYGLGNKAVAFLKTDERFQDHSIGNIFFDHTIFVSDVMIALELACRRNGNVRLIHEDELPIPSNARSSNHRLIRWKVKVGGTKLTVVPDRVFALEYGGRRAFFFLEADRGTMPVMRSSPHQTSFNRKLVAYEATWNQALHRSRLGIHRFRVLTVTTSAKRMESLVTACSKLKSGHGLFLFANESVLSGNVLSNQWFAGRPGETGTLLD